MDYTDDRFSWNEEKAAINERDHGVAFGEAMQVFNDPREVEYFDPDHSTPEEPRWVRIGLSGRRLLFVVFTLREDLIHIIHARKASKSMERIYVEESS
ncbi:MAG: BrnT family toxin [Acidobacteriota bacterium]